MNGDTNLPEFPLESQADAYFRNIKDTSIEPTGCDKSLYLDLAERIVRAAVAWQDESGRIIDPNVQEEWNHASPRYASSVGPLIRMGRCEDLLESCVKCIDTGVRDLLAGKCKAPDFTPRDLVLAIDCLGNRVDKARVAEWKRLLGGYDPQQMYTSVTSKKKPEDIYNFSVYNLTGEQMKRHIGAGDNLAFIEEHLSIQRRRFTPYGMYCDPNCPMTYDLTDRQNLVLLLNYGYDGAHRDFADEVLRRGGLTQLFFQSTTGETPFGGRSNQFHHMEGMFACNAEFEASRYARLGNPQLAGAFKRAARRAAAATARWVLEATPFRHIKNMFGPDTLHGCDGYGHVSVYSLLASNLFAYAAMIADDSIPERAAPCDVGGYVVPILEGFHRVFAASGPIHLQIDTCGQPGYDATGLCRVHHRDKPSELALSLGIVAHPHYKTCEPPHAESVAIGPCWRGTDGGWQSLAAAQPKTSRLTVGECNISRVAFRLAYDTKPAVVEDYVVTPDLVEISSSVASGPIRFTIPLILTDGQATSTITHTATGFIVAYRATQFRAEAAGPGVSVGRMNVRAPNRNAVYDIGYFDAEANCVSVRLQFA